MPSKELSVVSASNASHLFVSLHSLDYFHFSFYRYCSVLFSSARHITTAFTLASRRPGLETKLLCRCTLRSSALHTKAPLLEDAHTWQPTLDTWPNIWLDTQTHVHTFEISQTECQYAGDIVYGRRGAGREAQAGLGSESPFVTSAQDCCISFLAAVLASSSVPLPSADRDMKWPARQFQVETLRQFFYNKALSTCITSQSHSGRKLPFSLASGWSASPSA